MKYINIYITVFIVILVAGACELDNYDAPDASFYGTLLDFETSDAVEQDIINGSQLEYIELGWENPEIQYMVFKNDGTFRNDLMFSGTYTMRLVRGNFVPIDSMNVVVSGDTKKDFTVQPYIRVENASIQKNGNMVTATFTLDQTVANNVKTIGLYAHPEPSVGEPMHIVSTEQNINAVVDAATVHTLEIDLTANSNLLIPGNDYFFRVGALIDASQAKYNYATAVRISI